MSAEHTPTTDEVRIKYRASSLEQPGDDDEFDRWLDEARREWQARAWDAGVKAAQREAQREMVCERPRPIVNPFRSV